MRKQMSGVPAPSALSARAERWNLKAARSLNSVIPTGERSEREEPASVNLNEL
jgi:hypothetical protein